jgi:4'-phosphopantetheinyl transferase
MMSLYESKKSGLHLFALHIGPQLLKWQWDSLIVNLPNADRNRIVKYKYWQDRQRALLGNILVRWVIKRFTGLRHIHIVRDEVGRPYLDGNSWNGDFNLSHAGEWIVVALTNQGRVGIDVERIDQFNKDIMAYALSEAELKVILQKSKKDQTHLFYELWTMKEAIYKTGLFPNATPKFLDTIALKEQCKNIYTKLFYLDQNHPVSISWNRKQPLAKLLVLDRDQLF